MAQSMQLQAIEGRLQKALELLGIPSFHHGMCLFISTMASNVK